MVSTISTILRVWCLFYVQLFSASLLVVSDQDFFINSLELSLSSLESEACEGVIREPECKIALHQMKKNKLPGVNGLPYEFYRQFWPVLGRCL